MQKIMFEIDKVTKNNIKYKELNDVPIIGEIYIRKYVLGVHPPERILLTLEETL